MSKPKEGNCDRCGKRSVALNIVYFFHPDRTDTEHVCMRCFHSAIAASAELSRKRNPRRRQIRPGVRG